MKSLLLSRRLFTVPVLDVESYGLLVVLQSEQLHGHEPVFNHVDGHS